MSNISTNRIKAYVQQFYRLLPRSNQWGRLFQTPESLFVKVADHHPDIDSPYSGNPSVAPVNENTTTLGKLLSIMAIQIMKMDEIVYNLPNESTPSTAVDTLDEWESIYNIEDRTGTVEERQDRIQAVIDNETTPRSVQYIKDLATANGIVLTIEEIINPEGNEWFPWSGQIGAGEIGASTVGNYGWGGIIRITITSSTTLNYMEIEELLLPEIHHGTMVLPIEVAIPGDIIMTTVAPIDITQTTESPKTITQK